MAVEIREIVLTARVTSRPPATAAGAGDSRGGAPAGSTPGGTVPRELLDACLAEVRAWLERRADR